MLNLAGRATQNSTQKKTQTNHTKTMNKNLQMIQNEQNIDGC